MRPRFVVDNPRGPKGGQNDDRYMYSSSASAKRAVKRGARVGGVTVMGRVLELDLDDLDEPGSSPEAKYQHAERMMTKWSQRTLELQSGIADAGPLFRDAQPAGELAAIPELRRSDMQHLAEAFARWTAWCHTRSYPALKLRTKKPYEAERELGQAIRNVLAKLGEAAR